MKYLSKLCEDNPFGSFAAWVTKGTEITFNLSEQELKDKELTEKCWCCTFWRGLVIGAFSALILTILIVAIL